MELRLQNIRSLADTGFLEIRPITILVGQNSSGKSTFARTFPLLKQTAMATSSAPILWMGALVDFGDIGSVKRKSKGVRDVSLSLRISNNEIAHASRRARGTRLNFLYENTPEFTLTTTMEEVASKTRIKRYSVEFSGHKIDFMRRRRSQKYDIIVDDNRFCVDKAETGVRLTSPPKGLLAFPIPAFAEELDFMFRSPLVVARILETQRRYSEFDDNLIKKVAEIYDVKAFGQIYKGFSRPMGRQHIGKGVNFWEDVNENALKHGASEKKLVQVIFEIETLLIMAHLYELTALISNAISRLLDGVSYILPHRAQAERYYRFQELMVEGISPDGSNLAMFLNSLSTDQKNGFSKFCSDVLGFEISSSKKSGHASILAKRSGTNQATNIADMGFGFSQVLPILAQLWICQGRFGPSTIVMEQPELHLHPGLQAKLADAFATTVKPNSSSLSPIRILAETHSKEVINRLGELIEDKKLSKDDVAIYVFENAESENISHVEKASFSDNGDLLNWPLGFLG